MSGSRHTPRNRLAWGDLAEFFTDGTAAVLIELCREDLAHLEAAIAARKRLEPELELAEILPRILRSGARAEILAAMNPPPRQP